MTKVYDGYTNKELNRNYKTFKEAEIWFLNGGTSKP